MAGYEVTSSRIAHEGVLSRVRIDTVALPRGESVEREVVEHPSAVAVVVLDAEGHVGLLRQYRHPLGERVLEIPAGKLDVAGESAEQAARRELAEEMGVVVEGLTELIRFANSAGWTTEMTTIYLARVSGGAQADADFEPHAEEADMAQLWVPLDRVAEMAVGGELQDAKTILGVLLAERRRAEGAAHGGDEHGGTG
jgi:ADP-ribose pyrophosphatase